MSESCKFVCYKPRFSSLQSQRIYAVIGNRFSWSFFSILGKHLHIIGIWQHLMMYRTIPTNCSCNNELLSFRKDIMMYRTTLPIVLVIMYRSVGVKLLSCDHKVMSLNSENSLYKNAMKDCTKDPKWLDHALPTPGCSEKTFF
jgi:hypothetical protein